MSSFLSLSAGTAAVLASLLWAGTAQARLGTDVSSVVDDAREFRTMPIAEQVHGLDRQTLRQGKTTIHEYVGSAGQIYAITFRGGRTPNLAVLLGTHHAAFVAHASHDHRTATVDTPTLKARLHGRPGAISGVIWLPALLPAGVTVESLQ